MLDPGMGAAPHAVGGCCCCCCCCCCCAWDLLEGAVFSSISCFLNMSSFSRVAASLASSSCCRARSLRSCAFRGAEAAESLPDNDFEVGSRLMLALALLPLLLAPLLRLLTERWDCDDRTDIPLPLPLLLPPPCPLLRLELLVPREVDEGGRGKFSSSIKNRSRSSCFIWPMSFRWPESRSCFLFEAINK